MENLNSLQNFLNYLQEFLEKVDQEKEIVGNIINHKLKLGCDVASLVKKAKRVADACDRVLMQG